MPDPGGEELGGDMRSRLGRTLSNWECETNEPLRTSLQHKRYLVPDRPTSLTS
jgi:hypothetical protein